MNLQQILTDITSILGAIGMICTVLAHLPFPAKWAERFARFATYAANAKFSVNQRDTLPKPPSSTGAALVFLFVTAFALHASACSSRKPPCDQAKLAGVVASCVVQSQQCVNDGKSEAECKSLVDCDAAIEKACGQ